MSIPKSWIEKHQLKKGDIVYINENDADLSILPQIKETPETPKEIVIEVANKPKAIISREIAAAYTNNYSKIIITGSNENFNVSDAREEIQNLMALEIIEQNSKKVVARDFLNLKQISLKSMFKKMDMITRELLIDSKNVKSIDDAKIIANRDKDINRLFYLIVRAARKVISEPSLKRNFEMTDLQLVDLVSSANFIEAIGDECKNFSNNFYKVILSEDDMSELLTLYSRIEKHYMESLNTFYSKKSNKAFELGCVRDELVKACNDLAAKHNNNIHVVNTLLHMKTIVKHIHSIVKTCYMGFA